MTPTSNARYLGHVISEPLQIMSPDQIGQAAPTEPPHDDQDPDPEEMPDQDYDSQPTKYDP